MLIENPHDKKVRMMKVRDSDSDRQFATTNKWALATDGVQWVLQRRRWRNGQPTWRALAFVHSTRDTLARCMVEKGLPEEDVRRLLCDLPRTFEEWHQNRRGGWSETLKAPPPSPDAPPPQTSPEPALRQEPAV